MKLFEPLRINTMRLENRIVLTAMVTRLSGDDGYVNKDIRDRYLRFARGEPGLIVLEAMGVHSVRSGPLLRLSEDRFIPGLRDLAQEIHDMSPSRVVPQIIHFLKVARSGWRQKIIDLTKAEIQTIVEQYGAAAARARVAGFDGVELHMAHAYTLSSFLSLRNARNDEYGRSVENRMRLMGEIITKCRGRVGGDFPIGIRFDGEECIKNGYTLVDAKRIALRAAQLGADYISISAGGKFEDAIHKPGEPLYPYTGYSGDRCMPSVTYPEAANGYLAEGIKRFINEGGFQVPVVTTGKIATPALAESILQEGKADLIGMARTLLADPDWPRKVREGQVDKIIGCVYGNVCKNLDENFMKVTCTLWPKGSLQAPVSQDAEPPAWPHGAQLVAKYNKGRVELSWQRAQDNEEVYGYDIFRAEGAAPLSRLTAVKRISYWDLTVFGGTAYRYQVRAYDLAGNRSAPSEIISVNVPMFSPEFSGEADAATVTAPVGCGDE